MSWSTTPPLLLRAQGTPLHALFNNAGANFMGVEPWFTEQGVAGLPQVWNMGRETAEPALKCRTIGGRPFSTGPYLSPTEPLPTPTSPSPLAPPPSPIH